MQSRSPAAALPHCAAATPPYSALDLSQINESRQSLFATHGDAGHGEAEPDDEATTLAELAPDQDTLDEADVDALLGM